MSDDLDPGSGPNGERERVGDLAAERLRAGLAPVVRAVRQHSRLPHLGGPVARAHLAPPAAMNAGRSVVDWALYVAGARVETHSYTEAVTRSRRGEGFVWIGLFEPTTEELAEIAADFDLHPLAVEDAVKAHQRPKLDRYDEALFMVLKTVRYLPHERRATAATLGAIVQSGEVMVFLGAHYVVTVRHGDHSELHGVRTRLESTPDLLTLGPSAVLHGVADTVVDGYLAVAEELEDDVEEMEVLVFSDRRSGDTGRVYQLKRELMELRRAVTPLVLPMRFLAHGSSPLVDKQVRKYFRDVEDHLSRVADQVSGYDELLSAIVQASLAKLSVAENEDMRKLAAWAAIIAVPTAIAGIYGMNFDSMPELHTRYGYPTVLVLIAVACTLLYRGFKRNGWL